MRSKIFAFLTSPVVLVPTILLSATLTYFTGGLGYFFGMAVALTALWASRFRWLLFGIGKPDWAKSILQALLLAILLFVGMDMAIQPFIEKALGTIDLSAFNGIRGNLVNYIILCLFMWVVAALGEEFLYRGYFMKQLAEKLGDTNRSWMISALAISAFFGMAHLYQGPSGVIATGIIGFYLSMIFYYNRTNLVICMLAHGFYDMIGITLIYYGRERIITDWVLEQLG